MVFDIDPHATNPDRKNRMPDTCGATTLASLGSINHRQTQSLSTRCSKTNPRGENGGITVATIIKILRSLRKDIPASVDYQLRILTSTAQSASKSDILNNTVKALNIYFKYYAQLFLKRDGSNGIIVLVRWRNGDGHFCVLVNNHGSPGIIDIQNFTRVLTLDFAFSKRGLGDPLQISVLEDTSPESGFVDDFMEPDDNQDFWEMPEGFTDDQKFYDTVMTKVVNGKNQFEYNSDLDAIREMSPEYVEHLGKMRSPETKSKRYKPKDKRTTMKQRRNPKKSTSRSQPSVQSNSHIAAQSASAELRAKQHERELLDKFKYDDKTKERDEMYIRRLRKSIKEVKAEKPIDKKALNRFRTEYTNTRKKIKRLEAKQM